MKVTAVIPYRNDPSLPRTIDNLKSLGVKYIVVDDCSQEKGHGTIRNVKRRGVGGAIDIGVKEVKTKYMCILGSDTIFTKGTPMDMIRGDQTISCSIDLGKGKRYGANLLIKLTASDLPHTSKLRHDNYRNILEAKWRKKSEKKIPCVLGACYVMNTEWYRYIKGFLGHRMWGTLEPYLSLKSWLAGGDCEITDVESNHIYGGNKNTTPYKYLLYNKLFISRTVLPDMADELDAYLGDNDMLIQARGMIESQKPFVDSTRDYYQSIFTRTLDDILKEFQTL